MPSLRNFITRLSEPRLLRTLLERHEVPVTANVRLDDTTAAFAAIDECINNCPRGTRAVLMADIERIEGLATEPGEVAIDSVTLHEELASLPSRHARALHVFLHDVQGFRRAEEIVYNDTQRLGRDWTPFGCKEGLDPASDPQAIEAFKEALRAHFDTPNVHVEVFERSRVGFPDDDDENDGRTLLSQITVYREDRPNTELAFRKDGALGTEVRSRVLEAALTYEPSTGIIECVGSQRDSRAEMARLMATTLLKTAPEFEPVPLRLYDLDPLRQRMTFDRDPEDAIEEVRVAMMRLSPVEASAERITIESMAKNGRDIWSAVEARLGSEALTSDYRIDQARIVVRYRSRESNRTRSLPILITHPHKSNIKDRVEIERVVANKYLPRWGLVAA
jgi:hypothetical protein